MSEQIQEKSKLLNKLILIATKLWQGLLLDLFLPLRFVQTPNTLNFTLTGFAAVHYRNCRQYYFRYYPIAGMDLNACLCRGYFYLCYNWLNQRHKR